MTIETIYTLANETLIKTLLVSGPVLVTGMIVGLAMGVFQSVTSIQETTVAFVPKMLFVGGLMVFMFPWMLSVLREFTIMLYTNLPQYAQ
ncbi:MAG: flagellar biosynthetic protein FliQ [Planctomycetota bacterium]|jgi:flagellar biosynthetic protein FliQ|nr:flagellar biosynthetic protein FliQ [Planctomycetota bacterium]